MMYSQQVEALTFDLQDTCQGNISVVGTLTMFYIYTQDHNSI